MEILVKRKAKNEKATIGQLYINGKFYCFTLEDRDRGLSQTMSREQTLEIKIHGQTAIGTGRYEVIIDFSSRFKRRLPLLKNVIGFAGIRIHSGNHSGNTEGCLLVGTWNKTDKDWISKSRIAFDPLFNSIDKALTNKEKVYITIVNEYS